MIIAKIQENYMTLYSVSNVKAVYDVFFVLAKELLLLHVIY